MDGETSKPTVRDRQCTLRQIVQQKKKLKDRQVDEVTNRLPVRD